MSLEEIKSSLDKIKSVLERHGAKFDDIYERLQYLEVSRKSSEIATTSSRVNDYGDFSSTTRAVFKTTFQSEEEITRNT